MTIDAASWREHSQQKVAVTGRNLETNTVQRLRLSCYSFMYMADNWEVRLLAGLHSLGVGMKEAPPADEVGLQACFAHVHHHSAHLAWLTCLGPCLD